MKIISKNHSLILEEIAKGYPGLSVDFGKFLLEACVITLHRSKHQAGTLLEVSGITKKGEKVLWRKKVTSQLDRSWKDQIEATQFAAACISILMAVKHTKFTVIERSVIGTGFDYWLGNETETIDVFDKKARLEVSGIFKGDEKMLEERVKVKIAQTKKSASTRLPAHISVVEFSKPRTKFVIKK